MYFYKLSTDEEFNDAVKQEFHCDELPSETESLNDDVSFDDTLSEVSGNIESDEINNEEFDRLLQEELQLGHQPVLTRISTSNKKLPAPSVPPPVLSFVNKNGDSTVCAPGNHAPVSDTKDSNQNATPVKVAAAVALQSLQVGNSTNKLTNTRTNTLTATPTNALADNDGTNTPTNTLIPTPTNTLADNDGTNNNSIVHDSPITAWDADHSNGETDQSMMLRYTYDDAFHHRRYMNDQRRLLGEKVDEDDPITCKIDCVSCYGNVPGVIHVFDSTREIDYKFGQRMFCTSFINSFLTLIAHDSHMIRAPYKSDECVIKSVSCSTPRSLPTYVKDLDKSVTHLVTIAFNDTHFVVLHFSLKDHTVVVLDGLNYSI